MKAARRIDHEIVGSEEASGTSRPKKRPDSQGRPAAISADWHGGPVALPNGRAVFCTAPTGRGGRDSHADEADLATFFPNNGIVRPPLPPLRLRGGQQGTLFFFASSVKRRESVFFFFFGRFI